MSTEQLRALRDAATKHYPKGDFFAADMVLLCNIAIAALEAEGAKACEQPAAQPQQPARTAVPLLYSTAGECERIMHAAAQAIAAERDSALERAEKAEAELAAVKARLLECPACRQLCHTTRADEDGNHRCAECELAALKAQEPVAWWWIEDGLMHEPSREAFTSNRLAAAPSASPLYAAPVASIPLAQHEAALAEARRDERERCAKVCEGLSDLDLYVRESSALMEAGAAIRALRDGEG